MSVSIIVPVYNEVDNILPMYRQLDKVLGGLGRDREILFVDDGSNDGTAERLRELAADDQYVRVIKFRRNYGQTAALQAGLEMATGDVIVTMDGDLQNDPADIPMMLRKLDEGYDVVLGWRKKRQDTWINRKLPSKIANWIISKVTGFPVHDLGCTLRVIRREIAQELELYGEMHRFIPILAHWRGARCTEVETNHRRRMFGQTKYGIDRTIRVVLDLITVKYMLDYFASPMKLFGRFGVLCGVVALVSAMLTVVMKFVSNTDMTGNPLLLLTVLSIMVSVQFFSLGLIGEVNARIYYGNQERQHFAIRELINFDNTEHEEQPTRRARVA